MRVAMVCYENPATFVGGVEHHAVELVRALQELGHDAELFTRAPDEDSPLPAERWGIPVTWIDLPLRRGRLPAYHHARLMRTVFHARLRRRLEAPDIVHSQDDAGMGALGHAPVVTTVHTDVLSEYEAAKQPLPRGLLQRVVVRWDVHRWRTYARRVDASIAVSPATAARMRDDLGFDPVVIPNGLQPVQQVDPETAKEATSTPFETNLLYFGRLAPVKRVDRALLALQDLPESIGLTIGGRGPDQERLQRCARDAGLEDRVRFLGYVAEADKPRVLAAADALVLPSEHEGQPIVLLEAIAQGTPVVVTERGWLPTELQPHAEQAPMAKGKAGLVEAIQNALDRERLTDPEVPDWRAIAQRTLDVYTQAP